MQILMITVEVITEQPLLLSHIGGVTEDHAWCREILSRSYFYVLTSIVPSDESIHTVEYIRSRAMIRNVC